MANAVQHFNITMLVYLDIFLWHLPPQWTTDQQHDDADSLSKHKDEGGHVIQEVANRIYSCPPSLTPTPSSPLTEAKVCKSQQSNINVGRSNGYMPGVKL